MVWVVNRIIRNLLFQCRFEESVSFLGQIASPQNVWAEKTSVCCRKAGRRAIVRASTAPSRPLEPNFANTYRCSRNRSGQSTLEPFRTTVFNTKAATHSIKITYYRSSSYLLDATRHNRLWFHQFRERNWLNLNGLLRQSIEQLAALAKGATAERDWAL